MTESTQIRERFLADAREHFFAAGATSGKLPSAARQDGSPCGCAEQRHGQSGV